MLPHHIVFLEGVSGVGKTTTAALLCDKLRSRGCNASCFLEGDFDNPLDPFHGTYPPPMPLPSFSDAYFKSWQAFANKRLSNDSVLILDGTLLHHQINDLIREYNASDEVITQHLSSLLCIIQHFNPVVFYLSSNDVGQCLRQARKNRGQSIPTDAKIAYWENRKRVDLFVLGKLSVASHVFNIDNGWNISIETVADSICRRRSRCV